MKVNIPNSLTLLRIVLIPVFVGVFYLPHDWAPAAATFIFWLASISDWLDGYLARKLNQQSKLGALLDPLADKLMVAIALMLLMTKHPDNNWMIFCTVVIISRELIVSALREWMASMNMSGVVAVANIGKLKTVAQMLALLFLIYEQDLFGLPSFEIGLGLLVLAAVLTLVSLIVYLKSAWHTIKSAT